MDNQIILAPQPKTNQENRMMNISEMGNWYNDFIHFSKEILKPNLDFGIIPGTGKNCLYKAGAEKLRVAYGFGVEFECIENLINWDRMFVDCTYKAIIRTKSGQIIAECEGNVNSEEQKYKYVWVSEDDLPLNLDKSKLKKKNSSISEFCFSVKKAETTGKYGKPLEYWHKFQEAIQNGTAKKIMKPTSKGESEAYEIGSNSYRIPNPDIVGLKNTMMKMSQKRAFVGAILIATGASEFFTQDLEDLAIEVDFIEIPRVEKIEEIKKTEIAKLSEDDKMKNYVTKEFKSCNSIESIEKKRDDLLARAKEKGHDLGAWFYDIYVSELDRIAESIESKELIIPAFTDNEILAMEALKESQAVLQKV